VKLWAISDLHVGHAENRRFLQELEGHPDDWLALAGDLGETSEQLAFVFETLGPRFRQLVWVPGNHELWANGRGTPRGLAKYAALVALCRKYGVLTPEDPYACFNDGSRSYLIAPLFTLYDYSFGLQGQSVEAAKAWSRSLGVECADEYLLHPDPYPSREAWCAARCALTEERLAAALAESALPSVLINHYPLRAELARLPAIPSFRIWCGTTRTHDWHVRFRAAVVLFGHLHIPQVQRIDGVRFEEVSLGYPRERARRPALARGLRQILPDPAAHATAVVQASNTASVP
jgi:predicted phosphodiesterase